MSELTSPFKTSVLRFYRFLKNLFAEFNSADPFTNSASIAFYTLFSLPAILYLLVQGAGLVFGDEAVSGQLFSQIDDVIGADAASLVENILAQAQLEDQKWWSAILSTVALLVGSTTVFVSMQNGLNYVWSVKPKPSAGIFKLLLDRLFSFTLVVSIGFLLIVSLLLETLIQLLSDNLIEYFEESSVHIAQGLNWVLGLIITSCLFSILQKVLPDVKITWKQAFVGGLSTTALFVLGKYLIGLYLDSSDLGTSYGAAGSLVLLLVWVYYTSTIVLFGGKITEVYVKSSSGRIKPSGHAMRYETKEITIEKGVEK